jgi:AbrB family looped-hinge helix DNA binding protein
MTLAKSKITAQGQISLPAEVRKKLGVGPGSTLEWDEVDSQIVVRRAGQFTSQDVHDVLFGKQSGTGKPVVNVKDAIRAHIRKKHARD